MTTLAAPPRDAAALWRQIATDCVWNPPLFVERVIGVTPDPWQAEAMMGLLDRKNAAVAGCNGAGKDAMACWVALWMLCTRPYAKGQITGPSRAQVFETIWPEIKKWIDRSPILSRVLVWTKTRVFWREHEARWFLIARTAQKAYSRDTGERAAEGLQGMHEEHVIVVLTESSGVEDVNWDAAESCCTREDNYLLAVGNPLRRSGRFYELFTKPAYQGWHHQHVGYRECAFMTDLDRAKFEGWITTYGADSAYCRVRCFGQFPEQGSPDSAVPWDFVVAAMERGAALEEPAVRDLQVGVDCARYGDNESVVAVRLGNEVTELRCYRGLSGPDLVGRVAECVRDYGGGLDTLLVVDDVGLGGSGVVDPLVQTHGYRRVVSTTGLVPKRHDRYENWDDEVWLEVLTAWLRAGKLPHDEVLLAQLTTRKYQFTGRNAEQRRLEPKDYLRRRGLPSPDRAEAVVYAVGDVSATPRSLVGDYGIGVGPMGANPEREPEPRWSHRLPVTRGGRIVEP